MSRWDLARADARYYGKRRLWVAWFRASASLLRPGLPFERCMECGRASGGFWAEQSLWDAVYPRHAGPDGGGTACASCFVLAARATTGERPFIAESDERADRLLASP